jgi:hypothetical protein
LIDCIIADAWAEVSNAGAVKRKRPLSCDTLKMQSTVLEYPGGADV